MTFKDFDAAEAERTGDPVRFRLGGQEWTAAHINAANFLALCRAQSNGGNEAVMGFADYLTSTLEEDERAPFLLMLQERDIQLQTLNELGEWIVQQATGNPTDAAAPSVTPRSKRGQRPRVVSLSQGSTGERSHSAAG